MAILILIGVILIFGIIAFANEEYIWSSIFVFGMITLAYFGLPAVSEFVNGGWKSILTYYMPIYIGIGIAVATSKWILTTIKVANIVREVRQAFNEKFQTVDDMLPEFRRKAFIKYFDDEHPLSRPLKVYPVDYKSETAITDAIMPRAKDNVDVITIWILEWPLVIISTLISDVLTKIGKWVARITDVLFSFIGRTLINRATKGL